LSRGSGPGGPFLGWSPVPTVPPSALLLSPGWFGATSPPFFDASNATAATTDTLTKKSAPVPSGFHRLCVSPLNDPSCSAVALASSLGLSVRLFLLRPPLHNIRHHSTPASNHFPPSLCLRSAKRAKPGESFAFTTKKAGGTRWHLFPCFLCPFPRATHLAAALGAPPSAASSSCSHLAVA